MRRQLYTLILLLPCRAFLVAQHGYYGCRTNPLGRRASQSAVESGESDPEADTNLAIGASEQVTTLQQQAETLRRDVEAMRKDLDECAEEKLRKQTEDVDRWIAQLLVNQTIDENTQILNTVEQVTETLKEGRFSQEQVNKMFDRICETGPPQSRSSLSPFLALLVDAAGKLDCIEREDNPNKRWSGRVERHLRKRLFAMDWGFELEKEPESDRFL